MLKLGEAFEPTCLMVGVTESGLPFMAQNLAPLCPIAYVGNKCPMPSVEDQKKVFAQMVASIWSLHAIDRAHNDLHGTNIVLDTDVSPPHVALVDLGDVSTIERAYKDNYKRDANAFWNHGGVLARCNADARWSNNKNLMRQRKPKFLECLKQKWNVGPDFIQALSKVIDGGIAMSTEQHVEGLFNSKFVQKNLPNVESTYPWAGTVECRGCRKWTDEQWKSKFADPSKKLTNCPMWGWFGPSAQTSDAWHNSAGEEPSEHEVICCCKNSKCDYAEAGQDGAEAVETSRYNTFTCCKNKYGKCNNGVSKIFGNKWKEVDNFKCR
jgi:hypothetical protein